MVKTKKHIKKFNLKEVHAAGCSVRYPADKTPCTTVSGDTTTCPSATYY